MKGSRQGHMRSFSDNTNWVVDLGHGGERNVLVNRPSVFHEARGAEYTPKYGGSMVLPGYMRYFGEDPAYWPRQDAAHSTNNITCEETNQMHPLMCACPYAHTKSRSGNLEAFTGNLKPRNLEAFTSEKGTLRQFGSDSKIQREENFLQRDKNFVQREENFVQRNENFGAQLRLEASYAKQNLGRRTCRHDLHKNTVCSNCGTDRTSLWRRSSSGDPLCNACGLFKKLHGSSRPISLKTNIIRKRNRSRSTIGKKKPSQSEESAQSKYFVMQSEYFSSPSKLLDSKASGQCANDAWYAPAAQRDWVCPPTNEWNEECAYTLPLDIPVQRRRSLSNDLSAKPHVLTSTGNFSVY